MNKVDRVDKHMKISEVWDVLHAHGIYNNRYSDLVIALMITNCDYMEVGGHGHDCYLNCITE